MVIESSARLRKLRGFVAWEIVHWKEIQTIKVARFRWRLG